MAVIPFEGAQSRNRFYVPPTIQTDFTNLLNTEIPNFTYTFELIHNWYDTKDENSKPEYMRATYYPIDWKSKIGNSDMAENFKTDYNYDICKGDMVRMEDGTVLLLNWFVQTHINNQATQAAICNVDLVVTRDVDQELDDNGKVVTQAHTETIVDTIPALFAEYAGRPDYQLLSGNPGVIADMLIHGQVQLNEQTQNIRINDEFFWGISKYRVINLSYAEVEINGECGILNIYGKRVAGEQI